MNPLRDQRALYPLHAFTFILGLREPPRIFFIFILGAYCGFVGWVGYPNEFLKRQ